MLSHFMHQLSIGAECKPGEGTLAFTPSLPNGVMAQHLPEYLVNYRRPREAALQDIAMAKGAGVNTFMMLLSAGHLPGSQFANVIHAYWQAAEEDGAFKMSPDIWSIYDDRAKLQNVADALGLLREKHDGAWRRHHGRRVVSLMINPREKVLPFAEASEILFSQIGGRKDVFFVLYDPARCAKEYPEWFAAADGYTSWYTMDFGFCLNERADDEAAWKATGKEYWYPAMPSFTQSRSHGGVTPNLREKLGMASFLYDWDYALQNNAPAVCLPTWNDLTEDSAVMPESNHGYAFYELNRYYARWYQTGTPPAIQQEQILLFHHPQVVSGLLLPDGRKPEDPFPWARTTPPTDYVGVVAMLKESGKIAVQFGETVIAEREFPAGENAWFIYHPQEKQGGRHADDKPVCPTERPGFAITLLDKPFTDTELYVAVYRGDRRLGLFRSHRPILGAAGRGELTTIGDAFRLGP